MATQEITLKFRGDPAQIQSTLNGLKSAYASTIADITRQARQEAQAAAALQRQRSAALITVWKADTRAYESEERARTRAAESLQRQRSAALIAQWKAEQREAVRIARETENEKLRVQQEADRRRSAFVSGAVGGITALIGVSAISEIRAAGAAMLDYASKMETTKIAFTQMLGSAQLATAHLKELQQFALKTPFQFGELIDASQRMQALGFNAQQVIPILTDVGNAVAAAGGGSYRLELVVKAMSDVQAKGKLASQEIRQFAESGIPVYRILEEQLGKTRAELVKMVEKGEISSQIFLDAFHKFSQQNFGGLMEAQSKTFSGAMSNIKDALLQTSAVAFAPLYEKLSETAQRIGDLAINSKKFKDDMGVVGNQLVHVWDGAVESARILYDVYRVVLAGIVGQIGATVHAVFALVDALAAAIGALHALARAMTGDFAGALRDIEQVQRLSQRATGELQEALESEMAVVRELSNVYRDAAGRIRDFAGAQAAASAMAAAREALDPGGVFASTMAATSAASALANAPSDVSTKKTKKGSDPAATAVRAAELRLKAALDDLDEEDRVTERSLKNRAIMFDEYAAHVAVSESKRHQEIIAGLIAETKAANDLRDPLRKQIALLEIENKERAEKNRHLAAEDKLSDARLKIQNEINEFLKKQNKDIAEAAVATDKWNAAINDQIEALAKQGVVLDENTVKTLRFKAMVQVAREEVEAATKALLEMGDAHPFSVKDVGDVEVGAKAGAAANAVAGLPPELTLLGELLQSVQEQMVEFRASVHLNVIGAFHDMAGAIGQSIAAWALYGESIGKALKKALASILAQVAAEAAIQALLHLAYAIGRAAFGDFAGASKHALAALKFGAVAVAAGLGARAVAGGAFTSATGGGGGGGAASQSSGTAAAKGGPPKPTDIDRRSFDTPQGQTLTVNLGLKEGIVADHFKRDYTLNGVTRLIIQTDGQG